MGNGFGFRAVNRTDTRRPAGSIAAVASAMLRVGTLKPWVASE